MKCMFIAICTIAVLLAGSSSARPSPLLGLSELTSALPSTNQGNTLNGLTSAVPISDGSKGGLLKVRSSAINSETSSLEPRGMVPGLDSLTPLSELPMMKGGDAMSGLTSAVPILGGSGGGLLKVRRSSIDSQDSSLEPRGMVPGLDNLTGMTHMIPGMGHSSGALPGMDGLTSMLPGMDGSNGFMKVRRSTAVAPVHVKRLNLLGLDTPTSASKTAASTKTPSALNKSTGQLLPLSELPSTLSGLTL